jgi:hypothetical protein
MMRIELLLPGSLRFRLKAYILAKGQGVPFRARDVRAW